MVPRRVQVIRLFDKEFLDDEKYDPSKIPIDSDKWISVDKHQPDCSVCFVKNKRKCAKAIYLHGYTVPTPSKWVHVSEDFFIDKENITHWMPITQQNEEAY